MIKTGFLVIAILASLGQGKAYAQEANTRDVVIEWRFAQVSPAVGHVYMHFAYPERGPRQPSPGLYVENRTMLTVDDFQTLEWTVAENGLSLDVTLKPHAAARMVLESEKRLGQYWAALVNSRLVTAAKLNVVIGKNPDLPIFIGLPVPQDVANEIAARLKVRPRPPMR